MVDVHSHTRLMLLLMESSTARSTSPSSSWKREPTAMSLHQLHIRDQIPHLRNWPGQTQRKELRRRRKSQKSNLKQSTSCFLALLSFQVARTALSFHVVEYYCRIVFKVCFWIWLSMLQMPCYRILNCTSFYKFLLLQFNILGNRIQMKNPNHRNQYQHLLISALCSDGLRFLWMPEFQLSTMQIYIPAPAPSSLENVDWRTELCWISNIIIIIIRKTKRG